MDILFGSITPTNLGQLSKPGTDLESAGPDVFKTPPIFYKNCYVHHQRYQNQLE